MHERARYQDEAANHQLPIAVAVFIILFSSYFISQQMKNIEVVLPINCLACRGILVMHNTFPVKKHISHDASSISSQGTCLGCRPGSQLGSY